MASSTDAALLLPAHCPPGWPPSLRAGDCLAGDGTSAAVYMLEGLASTTCWRVWSLGSKKQGVGVREKHETNN